ncbi:MAG: ORF6N domain-containing protein [Pyrinomonadaceae bacterium]|nr:ORF6N domain-containing protein [Pyrinomonadaceae bacterium]
MAEKNKNSEETALVTLDLIERKIYIVREQKVMLDSDLANLYGVSTKRLNEQVKRNLQRFPEDFMFQLTNDELENLRSQIATSSSKTYGGRRYMPYVFTEQGVAMLSGVLNSERAVQVNIGIMRAFVKMRKMLIANEEIGKKLVEIENKLGDHDENFKKVFTAMRLLMKSPDKSDKEIGFIQKGKKKK